MLATSWKEILKALLRFTFQECSDDLSQTFSIRNFGCLQWKQGRYMLLFDDIKENSTPVGVGCDVIDHESNSFGTIY